LSSAITYFSYNNQFYEQISAAAMILSFLQLLTFSWNILRKKPPKNVKKSEVFRYINDTFVISKHGEQNFYKFLMFLNNQHPNIRFIMDRKKWKILLSECLITKKADRAILDHRMNRKPTHMDWYILTRTISHRFWWALDIL